MKWESEKCKRKQILFIKFYQKKCSEEKLMTTIFSRGIFYFQLYKLGTYVRELVLF